MLSIEELRTEVERLCMIINPDPQDMPTFRGFSDDGKPNIEIKNHEYHYVVSERGKQWVENFGDDLEGLLCRALTEVAALTATAYAASVESTNSTFRLIKFAKELELLNRLNPDWVERRRKVQEEALRNYP